MKGFATKVLEEPNLAFATTLALLLALGPVLASVTVGELSWDAWIHSLQVSSLVAGLAAAIVWAHSFRPGISWKWAAGLILQMMLGAVILLMAGQNKLPLLLSLGRFPTLQPIESIAILCGGPVMILSSIGILRDDWWGYYCEAAVLAIVLLHFASFPTGSGRHIPQTGHILSLMASVTPVLLLIGELCGRGRSRRMAQLQTPAGSSSSA